MKKILSILGVGGLCQIGHPQGTVDFSNLSPGLVNAPVYQSDGVTKLSGLQFIAELLAGPSATNLTSVATTGFLTGIAAGYFNDGTVVIGVNPGHTAWVQVDVWSVASGGSFSQAQASGLPNSWWQSGVFTVIPGGQVGNPIPPATLNGLGNSPVFLNGVVPEPSTFALSLVGASVFLLWRWRRNFSFQPLQAGSCGPRRVSD